MPNRWTGGFDVAIELAPGGANALLAAIHRKGHAIPDEPSPGPHLPHSVAVNLPLAGSTAAHGLKGHLEVQLSTPSVSVADGIPGRATVSLELYAWFQASFGSAPAPEFAHGSLSFTTPISLIECAGNTLAEINVGSADVAVSFTPAPGTNLSAAQRALVEEVVRDHLKQALKPVQFRISSLGSGDFAIGHIGFKTMRVGTKTAFALFLSFGPRTGPSPSVAAITELFLATNDDVGLALGRDFIAAKLVSAARAQLTGIQVSGTRYGVSFSAAPDPNSLRVELRPGALRAIIDGSGSISAGGSFGFRLTQDFGLSTSGGDLMLTLAAEPSLGITAGNPFLHIVFGLFRGAILNKIEVAAAGVVQVASAALNELVDRSIQDLVGEIGTSGVSLSMKRAAIDGDAVVLGGAFDLGGTKPAVAAFTNAIQQPQPLTIFGVTKFNAFQSWIPGGTIRGYKWFQMHAGAVVGTSTDEAHRFVLRPEPLATTFAEHYAWPPAKWCLEVRGTQFVNALDPVNVTRTVCGLSVLVHGLDLALDAELLTLEVPDAEGGVNVDVAPWARYRAHAFAGSTENRGVLLVHRAGGALREAVANVRKGLGELARKAPIFPTFVVKGGLRDQAREFADVALTSDPQGAWCKRFGLTTDGATVLIGAGGKELWRDAGPLRPEALQRALAGLDFKDARPPRSTPVRLNVQLGHLAPDVFFQCQPLIATSDLSISMAMKKLHGQELDLVFWTSWSAASLEELRRRAASKPGRERGPRLVLVNDGEDPKKAAEFLKKHGLAFEHHASDPDRTLSRKYGISCWPTVVSIDADGRVAGARFGLEHTHDHAGAREQADEQC